MSTVYLVGAGPGDPGLLTLAGRDALARADVVVYDRLVHPSLLDHAPAQAERVYVGKEAQRHALPQPEINALLADRALADKTVVRLKGGDPFVFGRGGEEAEFLRARGVPFVVVPGVTSAIAALAYAGIPVTHRDAASSFAVITGHERDDARESGARTAGPAEERRRWDRIAWAADTLVFLMGVEALPEIAARLRENGRDSQTPVALVEWGTWARQRVVTGTLATIVDAARTARIKPPAVTVVGEVVRWRDALAWFDNKPLWGKRVLVTRAREQASELGERLRRLGAEPIEFPTIRIAPPPDNYALLDAALARLASYDWVVFTSATAVDHFWQRLTKGNRDARAFGSAKIAVIGPATENALAKQNIRADFVPTEFVAEAVVAQFPEPVADKRILLPRAEEAREVLPQAWREAGATVDVVAAYRTQLQAEGADEVASMLRTGALDVITFTSSSTVKNFVQAVGEKTGPIVVGPNTLLAVIGPATAQTCRELLREPDVIADAFTIDGLVEALTRRL